MKGNYLTDWLAITFVFTVVTGNYSLWILEKKYETGATVLGGGFILNADLVLRREERCDEDLHLKISWGNKDINGKSNWTDFWYTDKSRQEVSGRKEASR